MGANIAGIYGAQIFRKDDSPLYRRGFSVAIAVIAVGLVLAVFRWLDDTLCRRRKARQTESTASEEDTSRAIEVKECPPSGFSNAVADTLIKIDTPGK